MYLQINIVGERGCGKTSLIDAYQPSTFPSVTSVSQYARYKLTKVKNIPVQAVLYDRIGLEDPDDVKTRSLMFMFSEITVLCYSIDSRESFEKISYQWWPELESSQAKLKKPFMLVGLKKDLRSTNQDPMNKKSEHVQVTNKEGKALAKSIGAMSFVECSAVTKEGVFEVFDAAINKQYEESGKSKVDIRNSWKYLCCCNVN